MYYIQYSTHTDYIILIKVPGIMSAAIVLGVPLTYARLYKSTFKTLLRHNNNIISDTYIIIHRLYIIGALCRLDNACNRVRRQRQLFE